MRVASNLPPGEAVPAEIGTEGVTLLIRILAGIREVKPEVLLLPDGVTAKRLHFLKEFGELPLVSLHRQFVDLAVPNCLRQFLTAHAGETNRVEGRLEGATFEELLEDKEIGLILLEPDPVFVRDEVIPFSPKTGVDEVAEDLLEQEALFVDHLWPTNENGPHAAQAEIQDRGIPGQVAILPALDMLTIPVDATVMANGLHHRVEDLLILHLLLNRDPDGHHVTFSALAEKGGGHESVKVDDDLANFHAHPRHAVADDAPVVMGGNLPAFRGDEGLFLVLHLRRPGGHDDHHGREDGVLTTATPLQTFRDKQLSGHDTTPWGC